jgi:hypothetical protein
MASVSWFSPYSSSGKFHLDIAMELSLLDYTVRPVIHFPVNKIKLNFSIAPADVYLKDTSHMTIFQNTFWQESPYKGPPTKEVLEKWAHITETGPLNITAEEMTKLGHSLDAVQYPPEAGGVSKSFFVRSYLFFVINY